MDISSITATIANLSALLDTKCGVQKGWSYLYNEPQFSSDQTADSQLYLWPSSVGTTLATLAFSPIVSENEHTSWKPPRSHTSTPRLWPPSSALACSSSLLRHGAGDKPSGLLGDFLLGHKTMTSQLATQAQRFHRMSTYSWTGSATLRERTDRHARFCDSVGKDSCWRRKQTTWQRTGIL